MVKKPTKSSKNQTKLDKTYIVIRSHKLIVFLLLLMMIFPASFAYEKYKDWDNAQMIKGLSRDFPELVEQIEKATGLELEVESNCMTTTEKFSNGVKTCEFAVGYIGLDNSEQVVGSVVRENDNFKKLGPTVNTNVSLRYRSKDSCNLWFADVERFRIDCIVAVRESNIDLTKEYINR